MPEVVLDLSIDNNRFRRFTLDRSEDVHGQSGTGVVAWGVQFPDGRVVVHWKDKHLPDGTTILGNIACWADIDHVEHIHGHEGRTIVTWIDKAI